MTTNAIERDIGPGLRAWQDLATRVQIDPRFPIPLHVSAVDFTEGESPCVRIRVVVTTTDARVTGSDNCERCILAIGGAPPICPHLNYPIDVGFFQWFPLRCSDAQRAEHVLDLLHHACAHELDEFVRIDGRLVRDPHGPAPTASEFVEDPASPGTESSDPQHWQAWLDLASRIQVDPRFPIPLHVSVVDASGGESPFVTVRSILAARDVPESAAGTSGRCDRDQCIHVTGHQWFPLRVSDAQKADHLLDLLHQAIERELSQCARVDGRLIRDPHAGRDPRR